mmetsp:Transcript_5318/g.5819  ORF Transcript_5318/g.5819 Transcript_5318/m.5819 type:complete len:1186 (-) Transcript_5318:647-4204(-)|eukprot:CAMPEP_0173160842 /NCGR_PEP_ID=MMETSP1105-20130129/18186_1 /TAXON_ID=2985 /ORGANISM="Ochromonas sp., Strain BG-1" /LENGTH=1185 /DNA_ID=CAMNT_0014080025 /DNA_START=133 /DNA_END=3690 /DNA_ORIENTATION=-
MLGSLKKRLSKSISRATEILSFTGPNPAKQFRNAIIDGEEDKAITIYLTLDGDKSLKDELPPCAPFPSKKNVVAETPLYLATKHGLQKLVRKLLELGGDPSLCNLRNETCLHLVCSLPDRPEIRAMILDLLINWEGKDTQGVPLEKVSINRVDEDGNCPVHYAASNGLITCVEKLITYGAIISIVNKNNLTCCEMADERNYKDLASMLELALVFQPEDKSMEGINIFGNEFDASNDTGKLFLDTKSLSNAGLNAFVEESITIVSKYIGWMNARHYRARAEALLAQYAWNGEKLVEEYLADGTKVLTAAKMNAETPMSFKNQALATSSPNIIADLGEVNVTVDDKVEEECGNCTICGDAMYCSADVNSFIRGTVTKPDNRALSCLSGHTFCTSCWSSHLIVQVNENGLGHLPCPGYKCGEFLDIQWAPLLLKSQDLVNRLKQQRQRNVIDCAGLKYCPVENCGLIVYLPSITNQAPAGSTPSKDGGTNFENILPRSGICANGHCFCLVCMQTAHSPCSCGEFPSWQKLVAEETKTVNVKDGSAANGDEIANALWVAANTKRCPRCGTAIEKDEGCNHMSCRKCRKEFCWICMQDWSLHSDNTGGYFQCNRFLESGNNNNTNSRGDSNDLLAEELWAEERGNAHAETMRLRERNRRMGRFIHHFTRYSAHEQSYQMEARMQRETLKRVTESLRSTREGKLLWLQGASVPIPLTSAATHELLQLSFNQQNSSEAKPSSSTVSRVSKAENPLVAAIEEALTPSIATVEKGTYASKDKDHLHENIRNHFLNSDVSLEFLINGFEELMKCRQFLQWTYPYAYFEFLDIDDNDYNVGARRNMWMRSRSQDHKTTFEFLQSDLESTVETLSDVVARRRLRASQNQINQATQAAKQKRVEFETFLSSYAAAKASTAASPNNPEMNRLEALTSRSNARSRMRTQNNFNNRARLQQRFADVSDARELSALLLELELAGSLANDSTGNRDGSYGAQRTRTNDRSNPYYSMPNTMDRGSSSRRRSHRPRPRQRNPATASPNPGASPSLPRTTSNNSLLASDANTNGAEEDEEDYADEDLEEDTLSYLRLTADNDRETLSNLNDYQLTRLAQHAEEEAELNRAILMSLQYANAAPSESSNNREQTVENVSETEVNGGGEQQNVETLMAMGFTRDQSIQALRETRGNVELAANRLLGLDF